MMGEKANGTNEKGKETDEKWQWIECFLSLSDLFQATVRVAIDDHKAADSYIYDNGGLYEWEGRKHGTFSAGTFNDYITLLIVVPEGY